MALRDSGGVARMSALNSTLGWERFVSEAHRLEEELFRTYDQLGELEEATKEVVDSFVEPANYAALTEEQLIAGYKRTVAAVLRAQSVLKSLQGLRS